LVGGSTPMSTTLEYRLELNAFAAARRTWGLLNGGLDRLRSTQFMSGWPTTGPLSSM
jgi:hypothetical protein